MPFPSGTGWNTDWEAYSVNNSLDISNGLGANALIIEYINAINERIAAVGGSGLLWSYSAPGYPTPSKLNVTQYEIKDLHHPYASGIRSTKCFYSYGAVPDGTSNLHNGFHQSAPPNDALGRLGSGTYPIVSGSSWPFLQATAAGLAGYFVRSINGLEFTLSSGVRDADKRILYTNPFEEGIQGVAPMSATDDAKRGNLNGDYGNIFCFGHRIGDRNHVPHSGISYARDIFPFPNGFRRKFPREIWDVSNSGVDGQTARFISYTQPNILFAPRPWFSSLLNENFYSYVSTPVDQRPLSGKIMKYYSASGGWIVAENQKDMPDIIETQGIAMPGDYIGPWILNDLRDAINQMVITFGTTRFYGYRNPIGDIYQPYFSDSPKFIGSVTPSFYQTFTYPSGNAKMITFPDHMPESEAQGVWNSLSLSNPNIDGWYGDQAPSGYSASLFNNNDNMTTQGSYMKFHADYPDSHSKQYFRSFTIVGIDGIGGRGNNRFKRQYNFYCSAIHSNAPVPQISGIIENRFDTHSDFSLFVSPSVYNILVESPNVEPIVEPYDITYQFDNFATVITSGYSTNLAIIGNSSLPFPGSNNIKDSVAGYRYWNFFATAKWDIDGGFQYTSSTT